MLKNFENFTMTKLYLFNKNILLILPGQPPQKMKRNILLLILGATILVSPLPSFSQKKDKDDEKTYSKSELKKFEELKKKQNEIFNDNDADFKITALPEKWNKESAVVLCQKFYFNYDFNAGNYGYVKLKELVRKRVKLLDRAAVDAFSEFYYRSAEFTGFRVVKADGKIVNVDSKNAVNVEAGVKIPWFFRTLYYSYSYKKIAIPDLEVGDIIDYFYQTTDFNYLATILIQYNYDPVVFTLAGTYPILKQKYEFIVDKNFFINFGSFNGAPQLKPVETSVVSDDKVSKKAKAYVLEDSDREKVAEEMWSYELLSDPMVKFQVYFVRPSKTDNCFDFIGKSTEARTDIATGEEVREIVMRYINFFSNSTEVSKARSWINKNHKGVTDAKQKAIIAYYYYRHAFNYYHYNYITGESTEYDGPNSWQFTNFMADLMKAFDLEDQSEIVAVVPRNLGNLKSLLLKGELNLGIRVGGNNGVLLFPFTRYTTHDYIDSDNMGMEAYVFSMDKKKKAEPVRKINIPSTSSESNTSNTEYTVKLDESMEMLDVKRISSYTGQLKAPYSPLALYTSDFSTADSKKYDPDFKEGPGTKNEKKVAEYNRKKEESEANKLKKQREALKSEIEDDFEVESYDSFKLLKAGREKDDPVLSYEEQFKLKSMVNKAGRNYSLDLGKFIGSQVKLEEKDLKREHDVYYNFQRTLQNTIVVELPVGYSVENLKELETNIDNEAGTFSSSAKMDGSKLIVTTTKIYKTNFSTKDKWSLWTNFLETAYNFSQKKIILKKT